MAKKVTSSTKRIESLVDIFGAVKKGLMQRGYVRRIPNNEETKESVESTDTTAKGPEELIDATEKAHEILFKANTVFPFTLFPDTVTLDREKLTFATRYFFSVAKLTSVPVRDILSVEADIGPFFGSVHTSSRYFITNPYSITFLWRKDAIKLQRLLQGYIIAHEQEIDCSAIPLKDLTKILNDLGKGDTS